MDEMLIITKESVQALKERLKNPGEIRECKEELEKMLDIKETLLWRAENACSSCSGVGWELPASLFGETRILEEALFALEEGDAIKASSILDDYIRR